MSEGIDDRQGSAGVIGDLMAALQVLGEEMRTPQIERRGEEKAVPPGILSGDADAACRGDDRLRQRRCAEKPQRIDFSKDFRGR